MVIFCATAPKETTRFAVMTFPKIAVSSIPLGNVAGVQLAFTFQLPLALRFQVAVVACKKEEQESKQPNNGMILKIPTRLKRLSDSLIAYKRFSAFRLHQGPNTLKFKGSERAAFNHSSIA